LRQTPLAILFRVVNTD